MKHDDPFFAWIKNILAVLQLTLLIPTSVVVLWKFLFRDIFDWLVVLQETEWVGNASVFDAVRAGVILTIAVTAYGVHRFSENGSRNILKGHLNTMVIMAVIAIVCLVLTALEVFPIWDFR